MQLLHWLIAALIVTQFVLGEQIRANTDGSYTAHASLTIKGQSSPITFDFTLRGVECRQTLEGTSSVLDGGSRLDRLALVQQTMGGDRRYRPVCDGQGACRGGSPRALIQRTIAPNRSTTAGGDYSRRFSQNRSLALNAVQRR